MGNCRVLIKQESVGKGKLAYVAIWLEHFIAAQAEVGAGYILAVGVLGDLIDARDAIVADHEKRGQKVAPAPPAPEDIQKLWVDAYSIGTIPLGKSRIAKVKVYDKPNKNNRTAKTKTNL